jgi:hypothetical protein
MFRGWEVKLRTILCKKKKRVAKFIEVKTGCKYYRLILERKFMHPSDLDSYAGRTISS